MDPVRIAVIGAGLIGRKHVEYTMACPDVELVAIADPDPSARAMAQANGATWWADVGEMLGAGGIDGAIVSVPTALHEKLGLQCVEAGVHALIEKPICHTLEAAERLNAAAETKEVHLLTGHHRRYSPWAAEARRIIADGALGRLVGLNCLWSVAKPEPYFAPEWRRSPGAGPVLTNLIHDVDLMRYIVGEITHVTAQTSNAMRGFQTEDSAVITLRFQTGALGTVFLSDAAPSPWTWEQSTGENAETFPANDQNAWRFFGTEAAMEFPRLKLWRHEGAPDWMTRIGCTSVFPEHADVYALQIAHFARVIRGLEAPIISGREGQKSLAATLAVFEAAETGRTIRL